MKFSLAIILLSIAISNGYSSDSDESFEIIGKTDLPKIIKYDGYEQTIENAIKIAKDGKNNFKKVYLELKKAQEDILCNFYLKQNEELELLLNEIDIVKPIGTKVLKETEYEKICIKCKETYNSFKILHKQTYENSIKSYSLLLEYKCDHNLYFNQYNLMLNNYQKALSNKLNMCGKKISNKLKLSL